MKTLMTGATGFVGGYLARSLAQRGDCLRCLVRSTSRRESLADIAGIEFVEGDLLDPSTLAGVADGIDLAFHLAAEGHVSAVSEEAHRRFVAVNVEGTRNLLGELIGTEVKKVGRPTGASSPSTSRGRGTCWGSSSART